MGWIDVFIRRPVLTWMLTLSLVVFGVLGYARLGVDQYPKMEFPTVNVTSTLEGASPEVMELPPIVSGPPRRRPPSQV